MSAAALRRMAELTEQETAFMEGLRTGMAGREAAVAAGFEARELSIIMKRPAILAAIDADIRENLEIAANLAGVFIPRIVSGAEHCTPVRMDAIKTVLDRTGRNTPAARPAPRFADADLSELSADELRRLVDGLERAKGKTIDALAERAKPVDAPRQNTLDDKLLSLLD